MSSPLPRELFELLREHALVRGHNRSFQDGEPQGTLLMFAEASLCLLTLERFLRVVLGTEATDHDTLPNLLEKATSARLAKLKLNADDRARAIKEIGHVRNTLLHGNYEQAAAAAGVGSVSEFFGKIFASEIEALHCITADLIEQVDPATAAWMRGVPPHRFVPA
jgi:hypothetical protein